MGLSFQIIDDDVRKIAPLARKANDVVRRECLVVAKAVGFDAERYAKVAAPVDRGQLRRSIVSKATPTGDGAQAKVGTNLVYGEVVEKGRRPGKMPPRAPIAAWARRKGIGAPAFVIQRAIARKGIKARPYLLPSVVRAVRESDRHVRPAIARINAAVFR